MKDFFDALSDFLSSDLAQNNMWAFIVFVIFCIVLTVFVTSLVFNKLLIPVKLRESDYIKPNYENALAEVEELREENIQLKNELNKYKNIKKMQEAIDRNDLDDDDDKALKTFLKKK